MTYKAEVFGRGGIAARVVADSLNVHESWRGEKATRLTTFELEYPRFIHNEFMTHRMVSKNAASSRAIPVEKMIEMIRARTAMPIHWGKNQPGMSAKEECNNVVHGWDGSLWSREEAWNRARDEAIGRALELHKAGYHKQIVNRLLEPFSFIKVVSTATEWDNLFWLRCHPDAQPEFQELARVMLEALNSSTPVHLTANDWHVPYFGDGYWKASENEEGSYKTALKVSASCCAQVSYRKNDPSEEKAESVYERLVRSKPVHASPFEHQARPFDRAIEKAFQQPGKLTIDGNNWWSGNLRNWLQFRQMVTDNVCEDYSGINPTKVEGEAVAGFDFEACAAVGVQPSEVAGEDGPDLEGFVQVGVHPDTFEKKESKIILL